MKQQLLYFFLLLAVASALHAQTQTAPSILWEKSYGGSGDDPAFSMQKTSDGGCVVAGYSTSNDSDVTGHHGSGSGDFWIVKLDSTGAMQWENSYGGTKPDVANSVQQTSDGGYIVGGDTQSNDGDVTGFHNYIDYWIVKLDSSGTIQWEKDFGGNAYDDATSVGQSSDGGYIVAGFSNTYNNGDVAGSHGNEDFWILKLGSSGASQWKKTLGGSGDESPRSIQQTTDGGYIGAGNTNSTDGDVTGNHDTRGIGTVGEMWIVKLDSTGTMQWNKCLGGSNDDFASSIQQIAGGDISWREIQSRMTVMSPEIMAGMIAGL